MVFKPQTFHERPAQAEIDNPTAADLEAKVAEAVATAASLDPTGIVITVDGTTATLAGTVSDPRERDVAHEAASRVDGISAVDNRIVVV